MRPKLEQMTLREKLGQTGIPGPGEVRKSVQKYGGYDAYLDQYPFSGVYVDASAVKKDGTSFTSPTEMSETLRTASINVKIPLFVTCDAELGGKAVFDELHRISTNMSVGAANDGELAYKRSYYWAREMRSCGVNWAFGPVIDLHKNFFAVSGVRCLSSDYRIAQEMIPYIVKGIQDAGIACCAKHYPSGSKDYRDTHFSSNTNNISLDEWFATNAKLWKAASDAGAMTVMTSHAAVPSMDNSCARGDILRPGSASRKVISILRNEIGFNGLLVTDAVSMKSLASAFEHEDIYIECFNAGNDIILFCRNDYIDIMEKAVLEGRVSIERVDEACSRVLDLKEKLGLFDGPLADNPLTLEENAEFDRINYTVGKRAMTLINNKMKMLPVDPEKVKNVAIINVAPYPGFRTDLNVMVKAFEDRGIQVKVLEYLKKKEELIELAQTQDLIIYACYLVQSRPQGMSFYSRKEDMSTLFHGLSFGAEKSIVASFGAPSIYYNYFENASTYINAYSSDGGTMRAFVDGILGQFPFTGKSPVTLRPAFKDM